MKRSHILALVVAGLFLACAGLLFPAVVRVREAAARMQCHSHFKGWSCAMHTHASANDDFFPGGTIPHPTLPPEQRLSLWVQMLPFLEQEKVYKQFDLTRGAGDPANERATSNRFKHLVCPSSGEPRYDSDDKTHHWKSPTPLTHYVGVAGVGADAAELPLKHSRTGVFGYTRQTSLKGGIPDGTSNTLLIIESAREPGHWAYGGFATVRAFEPGAPYIGAGRPFGGFHDGGPVLFGERRYGCVVALADGSVKQLTSATDPAVLEALATVGGKEELPPNW